MTLADLIEAHLTALHARDYASSTIVGRRRHLNRFQLWVGPRPAGCLTVHDLRRYQIHLARSGRAEMIGPSSQAQAITALRLLFRWAVRSGALNASPAADLESPRLPRRLPRAVLSLAEAEAVLRQPDVTSTIGIRDRTMLEVLYSCALRRMEILNLDLLDVDASRQLIHVRNGKGSRDRIVPVSARALCWIQRYVSNARWLPCSSAGQPLFVSARGNRLSRTRLTERLRRYLVAAGVTKPGSCHIWRHSAATHMHDGGADIRDLQVLLGHALLTTTQIYTHVSAERLKAVHARSHPLGDGVSDRFGMAE
jgi:integrase/recombinase XerD